MKELKVKNGNNIYTNFLSVNITVDCAIMFTIKFLIYYNR